jgi:hypothetical protein
LALNNIINRSVPGVNSFSISLVEETEPKEYQNKFFMFVKGIPSVRSDQSSTGRSYDANSSVTFKVEAEKALSMSFALKQYANGKGKAYEEAFGSFLIFADMSKSQYAGAGKKSLTIRMGQDKSGKANINIFLGHDAKKVGIFLTPYESYSTGMILEFLALKCLEYELQGPGMIVKKQLSSPKQQNYQQPQQNYQQPQQNYQQNSQPQFQQPQFQQPQQFSKPNPQTFTPTPTDNQNINQVTDTFTNIFGGDDPFGL